MNPCMPASRWRRLFKLKGKKKNTFKIIIGFFITPPLFLATKVAISFVYCSPKTIKYTQKPELEKKFTRIDQSSERASGYYSRHYIYNSLLRMRAIHELKSVRGPFLQTTHPFSLFNAFNHWRGSKKRRRRTARGQMERTVSLTTTTVECAYMQFFFFACSLFGLEKASFPSHKKSWRRP